MAAVLGLLVVVRVEVEVVENDGVGGRQVDAETAGFGRQDEDKDAVVVVELVDQNLPEKNNTFSKTVKLSPAKNPTAGGFFSSLAGREGRQRRNVKEFIPLRMTGKDLSSLRTADVGPTLGGSSSPICFSKQVDPLG